MIGYDKAQSMLQSNLKVLEIIVKQLLEFEKEGKFQVRVKNVLVLWE